MKDIEKCCYCGHPVTVEGFYDAESGEEWEKVTPIETENEELKQRVKKLEARLADAGTIQTEYCETIEYIEKLEKLEGNYRKMITEVIECHPQRVENGENEPPWELVKRIRLENEKLEATIAKHERREDSHMKQIEELISSKGIRELEARIADAEAHTQDFKDECERLSAALKLSH